MAQSPQMVEHLIIPKDKVPAAAYQALYHKLTSKTEKITELFPEAYEIKVEDIIQLDDLVNQVIKQYPVQSSNSTCTLSLRKNEKIFCSSIEKFRRLNFSTNKPTQHIEYNFDFFTILPVEIEQAADIVQRFKISVIIDQDFMEDSENGIPYFIRGMASGNNIRLTVEFSDYAVGRNLQVTIQDWVNSLKSRKILPIFIFMDKGSDFMNAFVPYVFVSACLFGLSKLFYAHSAQQVIQLTMLGLSITSLMFVLGRFLNTQLYQQLELAKPLTFICITNGDLARSEKLKKKNSLKIALSGFFGVTIVGGILINLFSDLLIKSFG